MTEITLEPYKRVIVRNCFQHRDADTFVKAMTAALPAGKYSGLLWANNVLFRHFPFLGTDAVAREYLKGNLYIDQLEFAAMEDYQSELSVKERGVVIYVADVSANILFDAISKWIKSNYLAQAPRPRARTRQ